MPLLRSATLKTALLFTAVALTQVRAFGGLVNNSPFMGRGNVGGPVTPSDPSTPQFHSVIQVDGKWQFSLFDPQKKRSTWVGLNETSEEYLVRKFDPNNETVAVEYQGRTLTLPLQQAKILTAQVPPQPQPPPVGHPPIPQPGNAPVVLNPTPADEQRRLESVAEEVRRRRAMRQQGQPSVQPQPAPK